MTARRTIVLLNTGHANDAETAAYQRRMFEPFGYSLEAYSIADPAIGRILGNMLAVRAHEIAFFLSSNYYGAKIVDREGRLLHAMTGIPLVIMQHDHPLYFMNELRPNLNGTITFAVGAESADFIKQHYPIRTVCAARAGARSAVPDRIPTVDAFLAKKNALLCPMNLAVAGLSMDGCWYAIKQLPEPRRTFAMRLTELAIADTQRSLHDLAGSLPPLEAHLRADGVRDWLLVLNFVKAWRRNAMVRELIELPMLLSSEYVPADLELKYGDKITLLSRDQTMELYGSYRFVVNSNPMMTDVLHERVLEALYQNSVVISDVNRAIAGYLEDERDFIAFPYGSSTIRAKIAAFLDDPDRAYGLTENAYRRRHSSRDFGMRDSYAGLIDIVDAWWLNASAPQTGAAPAAVG